MGVDAAEGLELVERALELSPADQTEAVLFTSRIALTRFANSVIHQNVSHRDRTLSLRLAFGQQIGTVRTNRTDGEGLKAAVSRAAAMARAQRPNADFQSFPKAGRPPAVEGYSAATAESTPEDRAEVVKEVIALVASHGVDRAFGALRAQTTEIAVANSQDVRAFQPVTSSHLAVTAIHEADEETGYGWGEDFHRDISRIDHRGAAHRAGEKAAASLGAQRIEPGDYAVVLEDNAVATMTLYLALAFGALAVQEGRSCVSGSLGERVTGEEITVWDEGTRPEGLPLAFDAEGVPKERVALLESGVAKSVVYDSLTAGREDRTSTGHALPSPNPLGPLAVNPFIKTGAARAEELIEETERGIYVTRFHYTNTVDARKGIITGMTRDGTFLIEKGEITRPVKNLRFTQGLLEALATTNLVGREARPFRYSDWIGLGAATVPALALGTFRFTGITEF